MDEEKRENNKLKLTDVLIPEAIDLSDPLIKNKYELFVHMSIMLEKAGRVGNSSAFINALYKRESSGSTYIGNGLAIPHGKCSSVINTSAAFCRCTPFIYESCEDKGEVSLVMMLAIADSTNDREYLKVLSSISRLLMKKNFINVLKTAVISEEIINIGQKEVD